MKYKITNASISYPYSATVQTIGGPVHKMHNIQNNYVNLDLTLEVYDCEDLSLDEIEEFLKGDQKIANDAPSYHELLKKYHPEYLL